MILAENGQEKLHLRVFNDKWANKFEIKTKDGKRQGPLENWRDHFNQISF